MNSQQRTLLQVVFVIVGIIGIYTFTSVAAPVRHYCSWTGLEIKERIGHEVTFTYFNGSVDYYCCVNISLLAFQRLVEENSLNLIEEIHVRCPMCGMLMAWDDPMIVWVLSKEYTNPTTNEVTIVPLCEDVEAEDLCESHFLDVYGGVIIENPFDF
ncbi:hypothetical protein EU537_07570 [Candidatus Thorarchaeota archaeon]|nr:MAG: hypothetical protein EU537_07570 [Candidatus Thorarchaeota archaeon]